MNKESLEITLRDKKTCFFSRSRQELWLKGETSGNYQHVVSVKYDCDADALLVEVKKDGPACHTGAESCFFNSLFEAEDYSSFTPEKLYELIKDRKVNPNEKSYTTYLFEKGLDKNKLQITYCTTGVRASYVAVILEELGYKVRNYEPSFARYANVGEVE